MFIVRKRRQPPAMTNTRMTVILVIVGGCFLVLVPTIFYPITKTAIRGILGYSEPDYFDENYENFIPRKVEMAMQTAPKRDSGSTTKKLPGRVRNLFYLFRIQTNQFYVLPTAPILHRLKHGQNV